MFRKFLSFMGISLWGVIILSLPERASATIPLTKAEVQELRNLVQLMPQNQPRRKARLRDAMTPGDGLSTGRSSLADLRFNDGSMARVGEQAVFRFLPKTRNFNLSNGTVLLLIPPGQGQTHINTPSAAAAIRGSALFVRYDKNSDTTIVGALTNSGIEVFNENASQRQELKAGQLMVVVKGKFQGLYDFDLRTFYDTSDLVRGLDLPGRNIPLRDPAIAKVQAETSAAVAAQKPIVGQGVVENPSFLRSSHSSDSASNNNPRSNNSPVNTLLETGQVVSNHDNQSTQSTGTYKPPQDTTTHTQVLPSVTTTGNGVQSTLQGIETINPSSVSNTPIQTLDAGGPKSSPLTSTGTDNTSKSSGNGIVNNPSTPTGTQPSNNGIVNNPSTPTVTQPSNPSTPTGTQPSNNGIVNNPSTPTGTQPSNNGIVNNPSTPTVTQPSNPSTPTGTQPSNNGIVNNPSTPTVTQPSNPSTPTVTQPSNPSTPTVTQPSNPSTPTVTQPSNPSTPTVTQPSNPSTPPFNGVYPSSTVTPSKSEIPTTVTPPSQQQPSQPSPSTTLTPGKADVLTKPPETPSTKQPTTTPTPTVTPTTTTPTPSSSRLGPGSNAQPVPLKPNT